jgi:hypothetical protein
MEQKDRVERRTPPQRGQLYDCDYRDGLFPHLSEVGIRGGGRPGEDDKVRNSNRDWNRRK